MTQLTVLAAFPEDLGPIHQFTWHLTTSPRESDALSGFCGQRMHRHTSKHPSTFNENKSSTFYFLKSTYSVLLGAHTHAP